MKVQRTSTATNTTQNLARWSEIATTALSGNISYGSNMGNATIFNPSVGAHVPNSDTSGNMVCWKATSSDPNLGPAPAGEIDIPHNLTYVPVTIHAQDTDNGAVLYRSTTPWTKAQIGTDPATGRRMLLPGHIYLRCTVAGAKYNVIIA